MADVITNKEAVTIRCAEPEDAALATKFMKKLGSFQKMLDKTTVTEEKMRKFLEDGAGEAIFAMADGREVAFLYYYFTASAFIGEKGMYIDALFIDEEYRSIGISKLMIDYAHEIALKRGCARMEWVCLDWNTLALDYYERMGAKKMGSLLVFRMPI